VDASRKRSACTTPCTVAAVVVPLFCTLTAALTILFYLLTPFVCTKYSSPSSSLVFCFSIRVWLEWCNRREFLRGVRLRRQQRLQRGHGPLLLLVGRVQLLACVLCVLQKPRLKHPPGAGGRRRRPWPRRRFQRRVVNSAGKISSSRKRGELCMEEGETEMLSFFLNVA